METVSKTAPTRPAKPALADTAARRRALKKNMPEVVYRAIFTAFPEVIAKFARGFADPGGFQAYVIVPQDPAIPTDDFAAREGVLVERWGELEGRLHRVLRSFR